MLLIDLAEQLEGETGLYKQLQGSESVDFCEVSYCHCFIHNCSLHKSNIQYCLAKISRSCDHAFPGLIWKEIGNCLQGCIHLVSECCPTQESIVSLLGQVTCNIARMEASVKTFKYAALPCRHYLQGEP